MKTFTYSILCILLFIMYACTPFEEENPVLINNESDIKELQDFAKECGYTDLTIDIPRPLTEKDIIFYQNLLIHNKKTNTRRSIQIQMYLTEIYYNGNKYTLRFDYSRDDETGEIREAYGGVYGRIKVNYGYNEYREMYTLYSKPSFLGKDRFDISIRAYYYTSRNYPYDESSIYDRHRYRLVIAAGLNVKTNTPNYQIHEQGEGEWELEP